MSGQDYVPQSFRNKARLLRVADKSYPSDYVEGLKSTPGGGYELLAASAAVGERVSLAIARLEAGRLKIYALGGQKATGTAQLYRPVGTTGAAINIMPGSVVGTKDGRNFVTTTQVSFGSSDAGPHNVSVQAIAVGYEFNVDGQFTAASGEVIEGQITEVVRLVTDVPQIDGTVAVRNLTPMSGGRAAWLDGLGEQFLIPRLPNESDDQYRLRIAEIGDVVSPDAIVRGVNKILGQYGATCTLYEIGIPPFTGFFDDAGSSADAVQNPDWNFADDMDFTLNPADRFKLDMNLLESRAFFLVEVPRFHNGEFGMFDDAGSSSDSPQHPEANFADDMTGIALGFEDGSESGNPEIYGPIWQIIFDKHGGGVGFDLVLAP